MSSRKVRLLAASISGNYRDHISVHSFLVGPEFSARPYGYGARVFGSALFGISCWSAGFGGLASNRPAFSFATLVGMDLTLSDDEHLSLRLFQAGCQYRQFPGNARHQLLFSTGLVMKLGK